MKNCRFYGQAPYKTAVIHGGPGAPGEMAPVARELSQTTGVIEPLQTTYTLDEQVEELKSVIETHTQPPITLIGHSWGAMLVFITAAKYPHLAEKLILIGSGPLEAKYAQEIMPARMSRLSKQEQEEVENIFLKINDPANNNNTNLMSRLGELASKADSYSPLPHDSEVIECNAGQFASVWIQAEQLRSSGGLVSLASGITCPVTAIHGDHDPHPADGVKIPLSKRIGSFNFILLEKCGHKPWIEEFASEKFYEILKRECCRSTNCLL
ncbi:MAG: alpha/beta hydrolase [Firmicutes bacterium]|nr:alpha/beta hydrolase [Bacillota bacterium]